jgi:hypothetical protein
MKRSQALDLIAEILEPFQLECSELLVSETILDSLEAAGVQILPKDGTFVSCEDCSCGAWIFTEWEEEEE